MKVLPMEDPGLLIFAMLILYIAVCFGKIAAKHGKNPILYGILSVISPINLIILGYWAFSSFESKPAVHDPNTPIG